MDLYINSHSYRRAVISGADLRQDRLYSQQEKMSKNVVTLLIGLLCCLLISNTSGRSIYSRHQPHHHHHQGGFGGPGGYGGGYNPYGGGGFGGFNPSFSNSNAASQSAAFNVNTPFGGFSASNSASNAFGSNFQG